MTTEALDLALAMFREPARVAELRERGLSPDLGQVIRIAAGETAAVAAAIERCDESEETLKEASVFFLQQVLFAPGADSYRTLGVEPDAPQEQLREHYRWLMKWLHPDRNQDGWEAVYADRVNAAWQDLKTPDRRAEYDRKLPTLTPLVHVSAPPVRMRAAGAVDSGPILSGSTVRRLPAIILGGLGLSAVLVLALMYWAQKSTERQLAARMVDDSAVPIVPVDATPAPPMPAIEPSPTATAAELTASGAAETEPAAHLDELADQASVPTPPPLELASPPQTIAGQANAQPSASAVEAVAAVAPPVVAVPAPVTGVNAPAATPSELPVTEAAVRPAPQTASAPPPDAALAPTSTPKVVTPIAPPAEPAPVATPVARAVVAIESAPAPAVSVPPPVPAAPTTQDSAALVADLKAAYASGNAARFEALFANGTVPADLRAIRSRLDSAQMRYMEFGDLRWDEQPGYRRAWISYRETYVLRGEKRGQTESGRLELHLALVGGRTQIARAHRQGGS